ncbi:MAG TPA: bifunctional GNAT family N-acetyltransferase/carbon-nitrogen hydrolase family protein, partial [Bacillales bacterium]|nr:bifunctional GNAT family N-acetyltransferase/carbon-nitrogen hydrolase family protein [Bacillales bacterium]
FKREHFESQLNIFPEGQVCIEYDGEIIGSCSSIIVNFEEYGEDHSFDEIADEGFIRNHNPDGVNLYGIEVVVHPDYRSMKIGRRLYEERRKICQKFNLKSILFGGRIPNFHKYADQMTAEEYVEQVIKKNLYDPVLTFQLMNGFQLRTVMPHYLPDDRVSLEYATLMEWHNPDYVPESESRWDGKPSYPVRISSVQYPFKQIESFDAFAAQCEYFVDAASKIRSDFVVFPETLTLQLLSFLDEKVPSLQVRKLADYTEDYARLFVNLAIRYSINIVAGSHFVKENDLLTNSGFLFRRDGTIARQDKLHVSQNERKWWGIQPGEELLVFDTDCGKVAILTGYDIQFPELSRMAVDLGAEIIFTPFSADNEQACLRIDHCAKARAVENQVFTVTASAVGHLTQVYHMNMQQGKSGIFSPIDYPFPGKGIVGECTANTESTVIGEVDLEALRRNRKIGTVTQLLDRRDDLYRVEKVNGSKVQVQS